MKPLIVANWKMNPETSDKTKELLDSINKETVKNREQVVICPPFVYLSLVKDIKKGAQNLFFEEKGAFTGEISPLMLKDAGCEYIILGHSERRKIFGESDELINKKIKAALRANLKPIFCIGETKEERENNITKKVLLSQIERGLDGVKEAELGNIILAYEPVWAIGTGISCETEKAKEAADFIREVVTKLYSLNLAKNTPVLYGGSVNSENAFSYIKEGNFNGLLVGGASLKAEEFLKIIKNVL